MVRLFIKVNKRKSFSLFTFLIIGYQILLCNHFHAIAQEVPLKKPSILKQILKTTNERGQVIVNVIEVDLSNKDFLPRTSLINKNNIKERESLYNIASSYMAYAGINANYFDVEAGNPLGLLVIDGEWLTGPIFNRVAVGFTASNNILIDQVKLTGNVKVYRGFFLKNIFAKFLVSHLNVPLHLLDGIGLFTSIWGDKFYIPKGKIAVEIKNGFVKHIVKDEAFIPKDGCILVGDSNSVLRYLTPGDYMEIRWLTVPDWTSVKEAVSGGPYLLKDGNIYIDEANQKLDFSKKGKYASRTAIGVGKNRNLFLVTADSGKRKEYSGLTLMQLAVLLKSIGLRDAINLDGGNSSTMYLDGKIINTPSGKEERKISSSLLIFYK